MKLQHVAMAAVLSLACAGSAGARPGANDLGTDSSSPSKNAQFSSGEKVPPRFSAYSSTEVEGGTCVVGAVGDEDAMNRRPYAYLTNTEDGYVRWVKALAIPENYYQGRATHCLRKGTSLYVLVQVDTQPQKTLSQTELSIVKLRMDDGSIEADVEVWVPNTEGAYSAWVWDDDGFRQMHDDLLVVGKYRYMDSEDDLPFSIVVNL